MKPIFTVNPIIGDESFVAAHGRLPTPDDDPRERVALHVGYAAKLLLARGGDPIRTRTLDLLDEYVAAGEFPESEAPFGRAPTFVDRLGVRCAVAHLVEHSAGTATMFALDRDHHNAYITDIAGDPRFVAWAETSGLSPDELAIIQPTYGGHPPPLPDPELDVRYEIAGEFAGAVAHSSDTTPGAIAMFDGVVRYVRNVIDAEDRVRPAVELDGKIGIAPGLAYDLALKGGFERRFRTAGDFRSDLYAYAGVAEDAYGSIRHALTVPIDLAYRIEVASSMLGIHGGPRIPIGDRELGWNAGIDLRVLAKNLDNGSLVKQDDDLISLDVTSLAGVVFAGVTLSVGNPRAHTWADP